VRVEVDKARGHYYQYTPAMQFVLGVDEAGRGPLAGPVAVGVVAVPERFDVAREFVGVKDSKQLSEKKREVLFEMLKARVAQGDARFTVCYASASTIDGCGITAVVRAAVCRGVRALAAEPGDTKVYLDGLLYAPREYAQETIVHGDDLIPIISLASIVAKVSRDRLMARYAKRFPHYGFEAHKGYGTKAHYEALALYGPSPIHRRSYLHLDRVPPVGES
jgi:ribonuclease HII